MCILVFADVRAFARPHMLEYAYAHMSNYALLQYGIPATAGERKDTLPQVRKYISV